MVDNRSEQNRSFAALLLNVFEVSSPVFPARSKATRHPASCDSLESIPIPRWPFFAPLHATATQRRADVAPPVCVRAHLLHCIVDQGPRLTFVVPISLTRQPNSPPWSF